MIKLTDSKDIRIKILLYLDNEDFSLEQKPANKFLSELTTVDGQHDLGTIRRSLQDLVSEGYIMETTNEDGIINSCHLATVGAKLNECELKWNKDRSNSKRFIQKVGDIEKIPDMFLGITLKGKSFLTDRIIAESNHKLISESINDLKHRALIRPIEKIAIYVAVATSIISIVISILI